MARPSVGCSAEGSRSSDDGATRRAAIKTLHTGARMHVGLNDWYMATHGSDTAVIKVRDGTVREIGVASLALTRTPGSRLTFIKSFRL